MDSTESALLHFTDELLNNMDQNKISVIVLLESPKLLIAFDTISRYVNFAKLVYLSLRVPGSKAIYRNVNRSLNFRILYMIPYPLRVGYRKDPSWAR